MEPEHYSPPQHKSIPAEAERLEACERATEMGIFQEAAGASVQGGTIVHDE